VVIIIVTKITSTTVLAGATTIIMYRILPVYMEAQKVMETKLRCKTIVQASA